MMRIAFIGIVLFVSPVLMAASEPKEITVAPEATDEILANPGMGWQTFHRTAKQDKSLPKWIPSTVHYARWGWGELEPQPGKLNAEFLDKVLKETREAGQQLAFRVMCCSTDKGQPYHPKWIKEIGGKELQCDYEGQGPLPIPDLDDPIVLEKHLDFIKRLGQRYDGHADIHHIDLGSVGWWGEWHLSGSKNCKLTSLDNRNKIVDAYLAAFKKTPLVMLIGGGECLKRATQHGTGWRADCLGDMGGFSRTWSHMRQGYPTWIKEAGLQDTWKTAPVAWETCWDMRKWSNEGWSLRYIFNYALACHASVINNKSAPLPQGADVRPEIERFLRRLGYRLALTELKHAREVTPGGKIDLAMKWQNTGSAPCYKPYRLAYRLSNASGFSKNFTSKLTVNGWLPGSIDLFTAEFFQMPKDLPPGPINSVADSFALPADMPAGQYTLSVAIVNETSAPVVRLAIKGRENDGWYPVSKIQMVSEEKATAKIEFDITTKRPADRVEVENKDDTTALIVSSPSGIGSATIKPKSGQWPTKVILRLRLKGLESLTISNGKVTLGASVSSHGDQGQRLFLKDGGQETPIGEDDSNWMKIKIVGGEKVPLKDGYFEMVLPEALLKDSKQLTVNWIDFYRG